MAVIEEPPKAAGVRQLQVQPPPQQQLSKRTIPGANYHEQPDVAERVAMCRITLNSTQPTSQPAPAPCNIAAGPSEMGDLHEVDVSELKYANRMAAGHYDSPPWTLPFHGGRFRGGQLQKVFVIIGFTTAL